MGLPIRAAPPLLLPGLAHIVSGPFWGESPIEKSTSPGRQDACQKAQGRRSISAPVPCPLSRAFLPVQLLFLDHVCCWGMPPYWVCIATILGLHSPLCSHTGLECGQQQHRESLLFTVSFKSVGPFLPAFCIRPQL